LPLAAANAAAAAAAAAGTQYATYCVSSLFPVSLSSKDRAIGTFVPEYRTGADGESGLGSLCKHNASLSQCKRKVRRDDVGAISSHLVDCSTNLAIYLFSRTSSSSSDELFASNVS